VHNDNQKLNFLSMLEDLEKTPLSDGQAKSADRCGDYEVVYLEFAQKLEKQNNYLKALVLAVECKQFDGIECNDIEGKNWFDLRKELIGK